MSIKSILCYFNGEVDSLTALDAALVLTKARSAALRIVHFAAPSIPYGDGMGLTAYGLGAYGDGETIDLLEKEEVALTETARAYASEYAARHGVILEADGVKAILGAAHATFRSAIGRARDDLPKEGRTVDLIIAAYDLRSDNDLEPVLASLFHTGRPVLTFPRLPGSVWMSTAEARNIVVAWDGSLAAAKALREAIPFMAKATKVHILRVQDVSDIPDTHGEADVLDYLACHGVTAEFVHTKAGQLGIGSALLERSSVLQADLLVLGAYGHGHLGEAILGGVADHVIKHAHLPLLLAH